MRKYKGHYFVQTGMLGTMECSYCGNEALNVLRSGGAPKECPENDYKEKPSFDRVPVK